MQKEHLEILLEQMDSKFDLVLESYEVLRGEIAAHGRRTDERFDLVDFKIDTLNRKIDAVDEKLSKQIGAVDEKLSRGSRNWMKGFRKESMRLRRTSRRTSMPSPRTSARTEPTLRHITVPGA